MRSFTWIKMLIRSFLETPFHRQLFRYNLQSKRVSAGLCSFVLKHDRIGFAEITSPQSAPAPVSFSAAIRSSYLPVTLYGNMVDGAFLSFAYSQGSSSS